MFLFFGPKTGGMLTPQLGIEPPTPALEGEVLILDCQGSPLSCMLLRAGMHWYFNPSVQHMADTQEMFVG